MKPGDMVSVSGEVISVSANCIDVKFPMCGSLTFLAELVRPARADQTTAALARQARLHAKARDVIAEYLYELTRLRDCPSYAAAILARLAQAGLLLAEQDELKE